jgi:Sigma-70, region 4
MTARHSQGGRDFFDLFQIDARVSLSSASGRCRDVADSSLDPLEQLIAAEEGEPQEEGPLPPQELRLDLLPAEERTVVRLWWLHGLTQATVAQRLGISLATVSVRSRRALERLTWIHGPYAWFSAREFEAAVRDQLEREDVLLLSTWWRTTSQTCAAYRVRRGRAHIHDRILPALDRLHRRAISESSLRKYSLGFSELHRWGKLKIFVPNPSRTTYSG